MLSLFEVEKSDRQNVTPSKMIKYQQDDHGKTEKDSRTALTQSACHFNFSDNLVTSEPSITCLYKRDGDRVVTKKEAARLASYVASRNKGRIPKGSFVAKLQSAADRNEHHREIGHPVLAMMRVEGPHPITEEYARDLQRRTAESNDGKVEKGSKASMAQSAVARSKMIKEADYNFYNSFLA